MQNAPNLRSLNDAAVAAGLSQVVWAKCSGVNRTRLTLAINGHLDLNEAELQAVQKALREVLSQRVTAFNRMLESNFASAVA